jgi:hypothetical protein
LFEFFEDATLFAGAVYGRLEFFAQSCEPFQALCVGEGVIQGVLERHFPFYQYVTTTAIGGSANSAKITANTIPEWRCNLFRAAEV